MIQMREKVYERMDGLVSSLDLADLEKGIKNIHKTMIKEGFEKNDANINTFIDIKVKEIQNKIKIKNEYTNKD